MEFKAGDRVHVTRRDGKEVDFYGTLIEVDNTISILVNCSDEKYTGLAVYLPTQSAFGKDNLDYYTLATDEEDTDKPEIQYITDMYNVARSMNYEATEIMQELPDDKVNHPAHYNYGEIEVIDFIEQVTKHYNSDVAYHIGNAIKYLARSPHKNGKEDIAKAKWYIERAYDKWE